MSKNQYKRHMQFYHGIFKGAGLVLPDYIPGHADNKKISHTHIKQRLDRVIQKRRVLLPYRDALELCNHRTIPHHAPRDRAVIEEIYAMVWQYNLRPTCITSYMRQAFVGEDYDIGLRVTFDTNVRYRAKDLKLHSKKIGPFMLSPKRVIMEIKVNERVPYWITELVAEHNFALIRISKYCTGLEAADRVPRPNYHFA